MSKNEHLPKDAPNYPSAVCTSRGVLNTPHLSHFTGAKKHRSTLGLNHSWQFRKADLLVDWGNKRHSKLAPISHKRSIPILALEDGFIRSLGLGVEGSRSFSIISDWTGIYYDATRPSDLENILQGSDSRSQKLSSLAARSQQLIAQICEQEISKYNNTLPIDLGKKTKKRILLVDQTAGDHSISTGMASQESFDLMLSEALEESTKTGAEILIKTHPDVISGKKQAHLIKKDYPRQIRLISNNCNPISLLKQVDDVRVVTSQMGFEACLLGLPVTCYGAPFYSSWGITQDKQPIARRTKIRSVEEVFSAAYILYPTYFDPETGALSDIETVLNHIERQKYYWQKNRGHLICVGFERWKHSYVRNFLKSPHNRIEFTDKLNASQFKNDSKVIAWGNNISDSDKELTRDNDLSLMTMEDGFIRSVQLGKYGAAPRSLVVDSVGIYFDPTQLSDLELLLEKTVFSIEEKLLAEEMRQTLIKQKISKYNIGDRNSLDIKPHKNSSQKIILVPGQVNTDASIKKGCNRIKTNIDLLKEVRAKNPDAYLLYKPHPDVVSGNIIETDSNHAEFADRIETQANIHLCIEQVDEVHTMTSLVGFEALLQNKIVYCYGTPFYSGWGLTVDMNSLSTPRRTRKLNLSELIAGTLIKYPRYIDLSTGEFTGANQTLKSLSQELEKKGVVKLRGNLASRWLLKIRHGGLGMLRNWL